MKYNLITPNLIFSGKQKRILLHRTGDLPPRPNRWHRRLVLSIVDPRAYPARIAPPDGAEPRNHHRIEVTPRPSVNTPTSVVTVVLWTTLAPRLCACVLCLTGAVRRLCDPGHVSETRALPSRPSRRV
ncbi:hypothetical protein GWI33_007531 [Rhynchophorus ferrugineus]|uniref:Uncharacterized protein n=1 Tax=Rhynchophorus ferrugineus TaxID=354439 RepID=A0A834IIR1_RHYFE|nr:hypothetical protein GWI33_007531 [Rhynchophorus ferrugineus]